MSDRLLNAIRKRKMAQYLFWILLNAFTITLVIFFLMKIFNPIANLEGGVNKNFLIGPTEEMVINIDKLNKALEFAKNNSIEPIAVYVDFVANIFLFLVPGFLWLTILSLLYYFKTKQNVLYERGIDNLADKREELARKMKELSKGDVKAKIEDKDAPTYGDEEINPIFNRNLQAVKEVISKKKAKHTKSNAPKTKEFLTHAQKRALKDGSKEIKETRQELQKMANNLRGKLSRTKVKFKKESLREMTKREIFDHISELQKKLINSI
ncbi:hypothetical protein [[Acholeplasma] multilocale]|uniref:hypothetical protein n=1 Tax=[Acholeplasma] multilocale TaxID=264638 RepID=UPI00047DE232|nr:hypothetical protein [[Acholeplasma] multilocale]